MKDLLGRDVLIAEIKVMGGGLSYKMVTFMLHVYSLAARRIIHTHKFTMVKFVRVRHSHFLSLIDNDRICVAARTEITNKTNNK